MAVKLSQSLKQTQSLTMTPQLQQAIKLLTLTHQEMTAEIAKELVENPMLEESGGDDSVDSKNEADYKSEKLEMQSEEATPESFKSESDIGKEGKDDFEWDKYVDLFNNHSSSPPSMVSQDFDELPNYENIVSKGIGLADHLKSQLRFQELSDDEWKLADSILNNLGSDGYLDIAFDDLISEVDFSREQAIKILSMIQKLDPVGCGARDLAECLICQARALEVHSPLVEIILEKYFKALETADTKLVIKALGVAEDKVLSAFAVIKSFNPKPGRLISADRVQYVEPDIFVVKIGTEYVVQVNNDGVPKLKISQLYQSLLAKKKANDAEAEEYIKEKVRSAIWLIKSIKNRQNTIERVAKAILRQQQDFFKKGPSHLKPMILKDVANEIGVHESTVSRVTNNKYMHTPIGLFELKYFFSTAIGGKNGGIDISSEVLKIKIKKLIESESPTKPLSDQKIATLLSREDVVIARRTVAKYREGLGILSSSKRKIKK